MTVRTEKIGLGYKVSKGMPWLDDVAKTMEQAFDPVLGQEAPRGPRDFLYGTWLGHSLHAAVITVPVGAWSASMIFDLLGEERTADLTLGLGVNIASAWLGGELAYELGIGVNHAAFEKPPTKWTDVAAVRGLVDGKPRRVEVDGTPVLLLRQGDRIRAIG